MFSVSVYVQLIEMICFLDEDIYQFIIGLIFEYGQQLGIFDENGVIIFILWEGEIMYLFYFSYGCWVLLFVVVQEMVKVGVYYWCSEL